MFIPMNLKPQIFKISELRDFMSSNFKLFLHDPKGNMHIKVWGDLINLSAHEFIKIMQAKHPGSNKITVYAEYSNHIHSFKIKLDGKNKKKLGWEIMEYKEEIIPLETNGCTRSGIDRRQYTYSSHIPERRSFRERRCKTIVKNNVLRMRKNNNEPQIFLRAKAF